MAQIELTSYCNLPDCTGNPGDIVEAPDDVAARLVEGNGAKYVTESTEESSEESTEESTEESSDEADDLEGKTKAELLAILDQLGGSAPSTATKADLVEIIHDLQLNQQRTLL